MKTLIFAVFVLISISNVSAAPYCIDRAASDASDIFIYTGTRQAALRKLYSDNSIFDDETAAIYDLYYISHDDLISYFLAESFEFSTPENLWKNSAYKFEYTFDDGTCLVVVDDLELYLQMKSSDSFVVRRLQHYERDRILKNLKELKTVY